MMHNVWWVKEIDHRVSTGIIFFIILMLWARGESRNRLPLRKLICLAFLCGTNWCIRYMIDTVLRAPMLSALGYSVLIMLMCLAFALCHLFCYHTTLGNTIYCTLIAVTVYRLAWNMFKTMTAVLGMWRVNLPFTAYSPAHSLYSYFVYLVVILLCYAFYRKAAHFELEYRAAAVIGMASVLIVCQMVLEYLYRYYADSVASAFMFYFTALMYCVINYVLLLMRLKVARLQQDNDSMQDFIRNKQQYYQISREGILSLQTKCHDLKHQIVRLRTAEGQRQFEKYISRLEDSIDEYNTVIRTGNEYIDVVLTEKNIICSSSNIKFSYMIDGTLFAFLDEMEIYSLFGNAMDNAIESMAQVSEPQKRFITLKAARRGSMVILYVENYYENELTYQDGILVTNKPEAHHHGFGLRSIMSVAKKYGGMASVQAENHMFSLTVTMAAGGAKKAAG